MSAGATLSQLIYIRCCEKRSVRPNQNILRQLDHAFASHIVKLDASQTLLGANGVQALLDFVEVHQGITALDLTKNGVDADCIHSLCRIWCAHQNLQSVNLSSNPLSVPSVRSLWEAAKKSKSVRRLELDDCGVAEEWTNRLDRCLKANDEYFLLGFHAPPPRSLNEWNTIYVAVAGPETLLPVLTNAVIPAVNSLASSLRVRVAPIVLLDGDSESTIAWKISLTRDSRNYHLPRALLLMDEDLSTSGTVQMALSLLAQYERPSIAPLRNKLGELRNPVSLQTPCTFVYIREGSAAADTPSRATTDDVADYEARDLKRRRDNEMKDFFRALDANEAVVCSRFVDVDTLALRSQTELVNSFHVLYDQTSPAPSMPVAGKGSVLGMDAAMLRQVDLCRELQPVGELNPTEVQAVMQYLDATVATSFPMVLYGAEGIGKSEVAAAACLRLAARRDANHLVVPFVVGHKTSTSPVALAYMLLALFGPKDLTLHFPQYEDLAQHVRRVIEQYSGTARISLFLLNAHRLETLSRRNLAVLGVLPNSLPPTLRIVVTTTTESPVLHHMRSRQPQPYERLVQPCSRKVRLDTLSSYMKEDGVVIRGLEDDALTEQAILIATSSALPNPVKALLAKEEADSHTFWFLLATYLRERSRRHTFGTEAETLAMCLEVPETVAGLLSQLIGLYSDRFGEDVIRGILMTLCVSQLPVTELVFVAETLACCVPHATLPVVLQLLVDKLLVQSADSVVHLRDGMLVDAVREHYGPRVFEEFNGIVGSHLHRLVVTRSPESAFAFRRCLGLLIHGMQLSQTESLVLDPKCVDEAVRQMPYVRVFLLDALYRLKHLDEMLHELLAIHPLSFQCNQTQRRIRLALFDVQRNWTDRYFFQLSLLRPSDSPYRQAAIASEEIPYPSLVRTNHKGEEQSSVAVEQLDGPGRHCHVLGDLVAVSTKRSALVFSLVSNSTLNRFDAPFGPQDAVLGTTLVSDTKALIIGETQLILWDLPSNTWILHANMTTSLSGLSLDSSRSHLAVVLPNTMQIAVLDLSKKHSQRAVAYEGGEIREVQYSGFTKNLLVVSVYEVTIVVEDSSRRVVLAHPAVVRCVASTPDGKIVVTAAGNQVFIWQATGDLLHLCDGHHAPVCSLAVRSDGSTIVSTGVDGRIFVWKTLTGLIVEELFVDLKDNAGGLGKVIPEFVTFTPDNTRIVARCNGFIRVWDAIGYLSTGAANASSGLVSFLAVSSSAIAAVTTVGELIVWSLRSPLPSVRSICDDRVMARCLLVNGQVSTRPITSLKTSPDEELLMALDEANDVTIWQSKTGKLLKRLPGVQALCSVDNHTLFTVEERRIVVSTLTEEEPFASYALPRDLPALEPRYDIQFTPDMSLLILIANCGVHTRILVYEMPSVKLIEQFIGHYDDVVSVLKLSDELLLSAAKDGTVRLWSLTGHAERTSYKHHCPIVSVMERTRKTVDSPVLFLDAEGVLYNVDLQEPNHVSHARIFAKVKKMSGALPSAKLVGAVKLSVRHLLAVDEVGAAHIFRDSESFGGMLECSLAEANCRSLPLVFRDGRVVLGQADGVVALYTLRVE